MKNCILLVRSLISPLYFAECLQPIFVTLYKENLLRLCFFEANNLKYHEYFFKARISHEMIYTMKMSMRQIPTCLPPCID